jgi:hypothetical protein
MYSRISITATTHQVAPKGAQRGEATGEVLCPRRLSHIAEMRCGEYQVRDGCQFDCPNAVKTARLAKLKLQMREHPGEDKYFQKTAYGLRRLYDLCVVCGIEKSRNPSPRCAECCDSGGAAPLRVRKEGP